MKEEKAEKYVKNEVCIKLCPTWKAHGEKCDLFPKCHYVSSKIKFYRLGLIESAAELEIKEGFIRYWKKAYKDKSNDMIEVCKENAELKKDKEWLDNTNNEQTEVILKLNEKIEKMKNFYNCSHSSRALCPNEHKCNGCKDWELAE